MSSFFRLAGMARPHAALRKPLSTTFFSTTAAKRPLPPNFYKQLSPSMVSKLKQPRSYSSGFGPQRQYGANMFLLKGLIGVNLAVWGYGTYALAQAKEGHAGNYIKFMHNMTMNLAEFKRGYYWQALTSMFTHQDFFHIGANLFTFWYLGRGLAAMPVTPGQFMFIVLGSGLSGSLLWLTQQEQKLQAGNGNTRQRGLGFSGALLGAMTVLACFEPRSTVQLYGIIPVPLGLIVLGYAAYDGYYLHSENSRVAHAGHLGGLAFGLAYYFLKLRRLRFPGSL
ncbi:hypothetical protein EKO04_000648 [Ascochyta lentis]|uniref:Peptidase S54 rhomboid domain-containing protein n=1 Tax=Ascochyta lentis TaxID=205686 RepID=A0A8H7JAS5_9PLEO|nr:hypothetical protein EKO04_000648 [Ascochyta lentis]